MEIFWPAPELIPVKRWRVPPRSRHRPEPRGIVAKEVFTIEESIKHKIEKARNWEKANPSLSWCESSYSEDEGKIYILKELLESIHYRSLSKVAMLVYQDFLSKRIMAKVKGGRKKIWKIQNNGEIIYPYSEAVEKGFTKAQFRNAIDELQEKGFIDITHQGKGGRKPAKGTGDVTTYMIDERWREYGTPDFKPPRNLRRKDKRSGRGFALLWNDPKHKKKLLEKQRLSKVRN
jgi:hypothetical protein